MTPLIALVGRPNVGKSTLFNRLTRTRKALVDSTPGMTRDRQYGECHWEERVLRVVDTGGFEPDPNETMAALVRQQALVAIEEADLVILVADAEAGPLPDDQQLVELLRRSGKPVACAVNKAEARQNRGGELAFHELGLEPVFGISALHGVGVDDLMEWVLEQLPPPPAAEPAPAGSLETIRVAVIGCPNVGKSSLVNRLLGEERLVASAIPGTTRDSVDTPLVGADGQPYLLIDTAGIRRKTRVSLRVERFSIVAALNALERADVAVLVLDPERGIGDQDRRVAGHALEAGRGLVIAVNKWDLIDSKKSAAEEFLQLVREAFPRFTHAPVLFVSAHSGRQVERLLPTVRKVWQAWRRRIGTGPLNRWLAETVARNTPPRTPNGQPVKIRYATQVAVGPPNFLLFCNHPEHVSESYQRYLENQLRDAFPLLGAPVRISFRAGGENPFADKARAEARRQYANPNTQRSNNANCRTQGGACRIPSRQPKRGR